MPIAWDEEKMAIGISDLDMQHRKLIEMLAKAQEMAKRGAVVELYPLVTDLLECSERHFVFEERLMQEQNYSRAQEHRVQHGEFKDAIWDTYQDFRNQSDSENPQVLENFILQLEDWFINHIQVEDRKFALELFRK